MALKLLAFMSFGLILISADTLNGFTNGNHLFEEIRYDQTIADLTADTSHAEQYFRKGLEFRQSLQFDSAAVYFDLASKLYEEKENWQRYLISRRNYANTYAERRMYSEVEPLYFALIEEIAEKLDDPAELTADIYINLSTMYSAVSKYNEALDIADKAIVLLDSLEEPNFNEYARVYDAKCMNLSRLSRFTSALGYCNKSIDVRNSASLPLNVIAIGYSNTGNVYRSMGNHSQALYHFQKGRSLFEQILPEPHRVFLMVDANIASLNRAMGNYNRALEMYHQVINGYQQMADPMAFNIYAIYQNIAGVYRAMGDYDTAIAHFETALDGISRSAGPESAAVARIYNALATTYQRKGEIDRAIELHLKALGIQNKVFDDPGSETFITYSQISDVYREKGDLDFALTYANEALELSDTLWGLEHNRASNIRTILGHIYSEKGQMDKAEVSYSESIDILINSFGTLHPDLAGNFKNLGDFYLKNGRISDAIDQYEQGIAALTSDADLNNFHSQLPGAGEVISNLHYFMLLDAYAGALNKLDAEDDRAIYVYDKIASIAGEVRRDFRAEGSRLQISAEIHSSMGNAIYTAYNRYKTSGDDKYKEKAFYYAEVHRSAVLQNAINESEARNFAAIPESILLEEANLNSSLSYLELELLKGEAPDEELSVMRRQFLELSNDYHALTNRLEQEFPDYYLLKYGSGTPTPNQVAQKLSSNDTYLQYFVRNEELYLFIITDSSYNVIRLETDSQLYDDIRVFTRSLRLSDPAGFLNTAHSLFHQLVLPAGEHLNDRESLVIVPDAELFHLPFESLLTEEPGDTGFAQFNMLPYLIRDYSISYHYSASLFIRGYRDQTGRLLANASSLSFGAFAPISFSGGEVDLASRNPDPDQLRYAFSDNPGRELPSLPFTMDEVNMISELFSGTNMTVHSFLHEEANKENFLSFASDYDILHIATHGFTNHAVPVLSGLAFAGSPDSNDYEILYSGELFNLNLNASLVVLSACETGVGRLANGEGLIAMTRGLLYAGAENILVSKWKVYDKHTSDLMIAFYSELLNGETIQNALRNAKISMIHNNATAFPGFWSGFIHIGS